MCFDDVVGRSKAGTDKQCVHEQRRRIVGRERCPCSIHCTRRDGGSGRDGNRKSSSTSAMGAWEARAVVWPADAAGSLMTRA